MSKGEDSSDNIGKITIQLDDLYKSDPILDHMKRLEEDRKALLSVHDLASVWGEPSIQERVEDIRAALDFPKLQNAFKSHEDYMAVASPLISALKEGNPQSLLEAFKLDTEPYLDPTYAQTLKATDLFAETLQNVSHLGLSEVPDYAEEMKKTMALYDDNFGLGNKKLVELATNFENDAFKNKFGLAGDISILSEALKPTTSVLDSVSKIQEQAAKDMKVITSVIPKYELPEIPYVEPPREEDSAHYKQNEKIIKNSEEQIFLLNQVTIHMSSQSEKLEFLNQITSQQIEENKATAEKQMEENRIVAEKEMATNARSSQGAMYVAISSIFISIVFALGSIALTYYVFVQEDISDNKDHAEVVQLLKANNINGSISELVDQLKIKNQNEKELVKLKKENVKMKLELEAKKSK